MLELDQLGMLKWKHSIEIKLNRQLHISFLTAEEWMGKPEGSKLISQNEVQKDKENEKLKKSSNRTHLYI